jgi:hypothetical protein
MMWTSHDHPRKTRASAHVALEHKQITTIPTHEITIDRLCFVARVATWIANHTTSPKLGGRDPLNGKTFVAYGTFTPNSGAGVQFSVVSDFNEFESVEGFEICADAASDVLLKLAPARVLEGSLVRGVAASVAALLFAYKRNSLIKVQTPRHPNSMRQ